MNTKRNTMGETLWEIHHGLIAIIGTQCVGRNSVGLTWEDNVGGTLKKGDCGSGIVRDTH